MARLTAQTPGDKLVKVILEGKGWKILKLIGFELEFMSVSMVGTGKFVVNQYSSMPSGILHGGPTAYVAECVGSVVSAYACKFQKVAGVEVNCNQLRPVAPGSDVVFNFKPVLLGTRTHIWDIKFEVEQPQQPGRNSKELPLQPVLVAVSRATIMVVPTVGVVPDGVNSFMGATFLEQS